MQNYKAYTYRIDFANKDYYFGWKTIKGDPESDGYYGSPVTNKHRWQEDIYCKTVIALHATQEIAIEHESVLIGDKYKTDSKCLNAHNNKNWYVINHTPEALRKISEAARKKRFNLTPEQRAKISAAHKGRIKKETTKQKIREKAIGRTHTKESKERLFITSFPMSNKKGKNFSTNNSTGKRRKSDFYETPYSITRKFLNVEEFDYDLTICEPACGAGAIVKVLKENTDNIVAYDIEKNFLSETEQYDYIITNPPFSIAQEFILKSKQVARKKFAFLLPLSYLHGKKRYDEIYCDREYPLKKVYVYTRYPMLGESLREDGKYNTGMMVYAWFVFDRDHEGPAAIDWIDNNEDVISKRDRIVGEGKLIFEDE